jgi:uncharacterized protein (DUF302 family)
MIYNKEINLCYDDALKKFEENIASIGFGVLAKIDIPKKFKEKNIEYDKSFTIFEICNPKEAKKVLDIDTKVAYFLPCKVIIYKESEKSSIGMIKPTSLVSAFDNEDLSDAAKAIEDKIVNYIENI